MPVVRTLYRLGDHDDDGDDKEKKELQVIPSFGGNNHKMSLHLEWQTSGMACRHLHLD